MKIGAKEIETIVSSKAIVFRSDYRHRQVRRDFIKRNPTVMPDRFFAFKNLLSTPDNHEGSEVNGNKTIDHHCENSGDKEKEYQIA